MPRRSGKCSWACQCSNSGRCGADTSHHMASAALPSRPWSQGRGCVAEAVRSGLQRARVSRWRPRCARKLNAVQHLSIIQILNDTTKESHERSHGEVAGHPRVPGRLSRRREPGADRHRAEPAAQRLPPHAARADPHGLRAPAAAARRLRPDDQDGLDGPELPQQVGRGRHLPAHHQPAGAGHRGTGPPGHRRRRAPDARGQGAGRTLRPPLRPRHGHRPAAVVQRRRPRLADDAAGRRRDRVRQPPGPRQAAELSARTRRPRSRRC